jgi:AcrR family transcriptional regulator
MVTKAGTRSKGASTKASHSPSKLPTSKSSTRPTAGSRKRTSPIREQVIAFKREQILTEAVDLFYELGYQRTSLDMVAERLGVTKPFIYYHFKDKAEILFEIGRRSIVQANQVLKGALSTPGKPSVRLYHTIVAMTRSVLESSRHTAIFFREEKNFSDADRAVLHKMHGEFDQMLVKLLEEGCKTGEFKVADPALCSLSIAGAVGWGYIWYRPNGRLSADEIAQHMAVMVMQMVGASPRDYSSAQAQA